MSTNCQTEYRAIYLFRKLENRKKAEICNFSACILCNCFVFGVDWLLSYGTAWLLYYLQIQILTSRCNYNPDSVKVHQRSMPKSSLKTQPSECWSKYFWNSPMSMWLPLMHSFRTPTSLKPSNFLQDKTSSGPLTCPSSSTLSLKITVFQNVSRYFLFWEQSCAYINEINSWIESVVLDIANNFFCCTKLCNAAHLIIFHCQFLTMPHQQLTSVAEP